MNEDTNANDEPVAYNAALFAQHLDAVLFQARLKAAQRPAAKIAEEAAAAKPQPERPGKQGFL